MEPTIKGAGKALELSIAILPLLLDRGGKSFPIADDWAG
jgi:hypothetical protein